MKKETQTTLLYAGLGLAGFYILGRLGSTRRSRPIKDPARLPQESLLVVSQDGTARYSRTFFRGVICTVRNEPVKRSLTGQARQLARLFQKASEQMVAANADSFDFGEGAEPVPIIDAISNNKKVVDELETKTPTQLEEEFAMLEEQASLYPGCEDVEDWDDVPVPPRTRPRPEEVGE